jgi:hypothetical protein
MLSDPVKHASLDPHSPLLRHAAQGNWVTLSKALPAGQLCRDEWYQDFVVRGGIEDIVGVRLFEDSSNTVLFGVHKEMGKRRRGQPGATRVRGDVRSVAGREPVGRGAHEGKEASRNCSDVGVQVSTLQTQLSSILKKAGVKTQVDLVRICSNIPITAEVDPDIR